MKSTLYKLVINDIIVAEGSARAMRCLRKKEAGRVWIDPAGKIGDILKSRQKLKGKIK